MLELEEALGHILAIVPSPVSELIALDAAHRRILTERVLSPVDLPIFDNSAMDGYAVHAADITSAKAEAPVRLRLIGKVVAGDSFNGTIANGCCVRVFTGSPLPTGADAVVMQEDTRLEKEGEIIMTEAAKPFENVRLRGEDVRKGTLLADKGEVLTAGRISLLAASGVTQVAVGRQP